MPEILYKDESYKIVGACFEVYNQKGFGFTEPVYQECLRAHRAQTLNYLNATEFDLAILVNFGQFPKLAYERLANSQRKVSSDSAADDTQRLD